MRAPFSKLTPVRALGLAGLALLPLAGSAWLAMGQLEPATEAKAPSAVPVRPSYLVAVREPTAEEAEQRRALARVEPRTFASTVNIALAPQPGAVDMPEDATLGTARLVSDVNMRSAPGTDSSVLRIATGGSAVTVLEARDGWSRARLENGDEGWIASRFLAAN